MFFEQKKVQLEKQFHRAQADNNWKKKPAGSKKKHKIPSLGNFERNTLHNIYYGKKNTFQL